MPNSIRTPKQGLTANSRRIAQAVDNEDWQRVRLSMKGESTVQKLETLKTYHYTTAHATHWYGPGDPNNPDCDTEMCDICIRVDNYIKALCRGGQLKAGESLQTCIVKGFYLEVIK